MGSHTIASDEAYARLLQQQENEAVGLDGPASIGANRQARDVRANAIQGQMRGVRNPVMSKAQLGMHYCLCIPQFITVIVFTVLYKDEMPSMFDTCGRMAVWSLGYVSRWMVTLFLHSLLQSRYRESETLHKVLGWWNIIGMLWWVIGNWWILFKPTQCDQQMPHLYKLAVAMLISNYVMVFLPCVILLLFIPFAICCLPCTLRVLARFNLHPPGEGVPGASAEIIDKLPSVVYREGMYIQEDSSCNICMCPYEVDETLRVLPCHPSHHYHASCVDDWLKLHATCPNCRANINDPAGGSAADGEAQV
mmetsp:Transcript_13243/g.25741  ORF Transcript_13243/g.25741 Transcript_13243/m.25741 type:complete len:307 (+) Transcript_13243:92-1012(+)|eukprot:CAMPEP_0175092250 /NCGR_PEP_ID=MMETSP0086_2-20121207/2361_1 /TAXON_ID=136419 /ORGANISM="Unknown Unknown, Strain D1" /LENGTH=306 /DNA_ID=CAMNT_0016365097 /DNA_START=91 /DNA_END=1011 /DNA_ORIENTATION=+